MGVFINLQTAKEITKARLRRDRDALLKDLDVKFQRALEAGADTTEIVTEKQRLRDITKLADEAQTVDDLKAIKVT